MLKNLKTKRAQAPYRRFSPRASTGQAPYRHYSLGSSTGQAVMGEYVVVIFLVVAVIGAMTIFFKRAVQARIHDARDYMEKEVRERTQGEFDGNLYLEYEPYYVNTYVPQIVREAVYNKTLSQGASSGVFVMGIDEKTDVPAAISVTLPPAAYDRTTPKN